MNGGSVCMLLLSVLVFVFVVGLFGVSVRLFEVSTSRGLMFMLSVLGIRFVLF